MHGLLHGSWRPSSPAEIMVNVVVKKSMAISLEEVVMESLGKTFLAATKKQPRANTEADNHIEPNSIWRLEQR